METQKVPSKNKNLFIGLGVGLLGLILCCCLVVVLLLVIDPFGWGLVGRFLGGQDKAAEAMPADTSMYVGFNLLNATPDKIFRLMQPWQSLMEDEGMEARDSESVLRQLNEDVLADLDMTFEEDIQPWVGQYAGVGVSNLRFGDYGELESFRLVISVEARNKNAADAFLVKLVDYIEREYDEPVDDEIYQDVTLYSWDTGDPDNQVTFARSGGLLLFSNNANSLKDAIEAQKKDSLWDEGAYKDTAKGLPRGRFMTLYLSNAGYREMLSAADSLGGVGISGQLEDQINWIDMAFSLSLLDEGLAMDTVVTYDPEKMTDDQRKTMQDMGKYRADSYFPADTMLYIAGEHLDITWKTVRDTLSSGELGQDYDEAMDMIVEQFGIDPDIELFPYLDREYAVGMFPAGGGFLADELDIPVSIAASFGSSQPESLSETLDKLSDVLQDEAGLPIDKTDLAGRSFYVINDDYSGREVLFYGIDKNLLLIGDGREGLELILEGGKSLDSHANYKDTWKAFDGGMVPLMYADLNAILDAIQVGLDEYSRESFDEVEPYLRPVTRIAAAFSPLKSNRVHMSLIIFIAIEKR